MRDTSALSFFFLTALIRLLRAVSRIDGLEWVGVESVFRPLRILLELAGPPRLCTAFMACGFTEFILPFAIEFAAFSTEETPPGTLAIVLRASRMPPASLIALVWLVGILTRADGRAFPFEPLALPYDLACP